MRQTQRRASILIFDIMSTLIVDCLDIITVRDHPFYPTATGYTVGMGMLTLELSFSKEWRLAPFSNLHNTPLR
jgi:hypothetical protein